MENAPSNNLGKNYINKILKKRVAKCTIIVYNEMQTMKRRLITKNK